jgi:hypothetical protein
MTNPARRARSQPRWTWMVVLLFVLLGSSWLLPSCQGTYAPEGGHHKDGDQLGLPPGASSEVDKSNWSPIELLAGAAFPDIENEFLLSNEDIKVLRRSLHAKCGDQR